MLQEHLHGQSPSRIPLVAAKPGTGGASSSRETWHWSCPATRPAARRQTRGSKAWLCFALLCFFLIQLKQEKEMLQVSEMPTSSNISCHALIIFLPFLFFFPAIYLWTDCCYPFSNLNRNSVWVPLFQIGITSSFELKIDC